MYDLANKMTFEQRPRSVCVLGVGGLTVWTQKKSTFPTEEVACAKVNGIKTS